MKKLILSLFLSVLFLNISTAQRGAQGTGFDGDNFSLEGALEIFKQSHSIKDFERNLNTRDRHVNNLDLNFDGRIDYIRVEHKRNRNYHAIILQVPISRREIQDIAVIEIEKTGRRTAMLQIVGDDYIYGNQVIVEPIARGRDTYRNGAINVYKWPAVRHILARSYNPWISPYRYSYYPTWWSPWNQYAYLDFYPRTSFYRSHYHYVTYHRLWRVYDFYRPYRVYCPVFLTRSNNVHVINGTVRKDVNVVNKTDKRRSSVRKNKTTDVARTTRPARSTTSTKSNTRRNTSPVRTKSSTKWNKRNTTSPTRSTTRTNSTYRPKTSTTPKRRSTSSVQRSTTRMSKQRSSATPTRRATTSRSTTRTKAMQRRN